MAPPSLACILTTASHTLMRVFSVQDSEALPSSSNGGGLPSTNDRSASALASASSSGNGVAIPGRSKAGGKQQGKEGEPEESGWRRRWTIVLLCFFAFMLWCVAAAARRL